MTCRSEAMSGEARSNEAVEEYRFKVGDKVVGRNCVGDPVSGKIDSIDGSDRQLPYHINNHGGWCREIDLEPANDNQPAAERSFKPGDRVVAVRRRPSGHAGTVVGFDDYMDWLLVEFDSWRDGHCGDGSLPSGAGWYLPHDWLLHAGGKVRPSSRPAIVARHSREDGQPWPAGTPYVHPDRAAAQQEAERLATNNPGVTFGVYELVSRITAEWPVAKTEAV